MSLAHGRGLVATPGPSVMPDRVLAAMHRPAPNIYGADFAGLVDTVLTDLAALARTGGDVAIYIGNGHAAWEAALANLFAPGDRVLALCAGRFGEGWAAVAQRLGLEVERMAFGFAEPVAPERLEERLRADRAGAIRGVLAVQTDTSSSARSDIAALGAAIRAAGHGALFLVDCIASLAVERFEMDAWGVDVALAASQKGLMTPPGLGIVFVGEKARRAAIPCPSPYWDWRPRLEPELFYQRFAGTPPTHHVFGLAEALGMILREEGLEAVWARHARLARAVWAAGAVWAEAGTVEMNVPDAAARSHGVSTLRMAQGRSLALQDWCARQAGLVLGVGIGGGGLGPSRLFRIGHMGHLDAPMLLGALGTVEMGLAACGISHGRGGVEAALAALAEG